MIYGDSPATPPQAKAKAQAPASPDGEPEVDQPWLRKRTAPARMAPLTRRAPSCSATSSTAIDEGLSTVSASYDKEPDVTAAAEVEQTTMEEEAEEEELLAYFPDTDLDDDDFDLDLL